MEPKVWIRIPEVRQDDLAVSNENNDRLYVFARFHAKFGLEHRAEQEIVKVLDPTRNELECLGANMFRSARNDRLHSSWQSEAGFDRHGEQPYTKAFVESVASLIDHPLKVVRTQLLD